jgi:hypothetical protein
VPSERPIGYLVREAPAEDVRALQQLSGHLQAGLFITKFRKIFARDEMNDDLAIVPARYGDAVDDSEYGSCCPCRRRDWAVPESASGRSTLRTSDCAHRWREPKRANDHAQQQGPLERR